MEFWALRYSFSKFQDFTQDLTQRLMQQMLYQPAMAIHMTFTTEIWIHRDGLGTVFIFGVDLYFCSPSQL